MKRAMYFTFVLFAGACSKKADKAPEPQPQPQPPPAEAGPAAAAAGSAAPMPVRESPKPTVDVSSGLDTPESAMIDDNYYIVTNIKGGPGDVDDNGSIVKVKADGTTLVPWIDGANPEVKLDAPKGFAIVDKVL